MAKRSTGNPDDPSPSTQADQAQVKSDSPPKKRAGLRITIRVENLKDDREDPVDATVPTPAPAKSPIREDGNDKSFVVEWPDAFGLPAVKGRRSDLTFTLLVGR